MKHCIKIIAVILFYTPGIQAQLYVQSGAVIKTTGNAVVTLQDMDLVNNGTINQLAGEGKFVFTGVADNTVSGSSNPLFDIFEIAKTGTAKIAVLQNVNIGTAVNFTSGLINLNSNTIYLQPSALLNGENENSRIIAGSGGYVEITSTLNAPPAINPGNLGAIITSAQNLGSTTIRRGHVSQVNASSAGSSILRYYDILPANNTALNASLRLYYFDAELNGLDENSLTLWKSSNNTTWLNMGYTVRDASTNYAGQSGLADFSRWTLSSINNALPVHFILFNINCTGNGVSVSWKTAQEENSDHFEIERSEDGIHFNTITTVPSAGNSSIEKTYSYTDNNASANNSFYRIAEIGTNGRKQYTVAKRIQCGVFNDEPKIWPNPVQQLLFVHVYTATASSISIKIFDGKGALAAAQSNQLLRGINQLNISTAHLTPGTYSVLLYWNNGKDYKAIKLVKN